MRASSEHIGRKGRCPSCQELVEIAVAGDESLATIEPAAAREPRRAGDARLGSTTVPGWKSGLVGAAITVVAYLLIYLFLKDEPFGKLFLDRGPMPYIISLVTCWGLAMLAIKYLAVKRQLSYAELELELIPLEIGVEITPDNVDQFLDHLGGLPLTQRRSILGRRIQGALEHFKSRKSVPEVQEYLATQAEIDGSGVDSGYTLLRAFIWAVPIMGFIGTVMGISIAVSGLDRAIGKRDADAAVGQFDGSAGQTSAERPTSAQENTTSALLMTGLGKVTTGLATAFDTTLIALVMAILLLFPTESLRRVEYGMLDRIEGFASESLLRRMSDERGPISAEELPDVVREALDSAFREHQRWLAQWQAQVSQLGQAVGADFESAVNRVQDQVSRTEASRLEEYQRLGRQLDEVFEKANRDTLTWQRSEQESRARSQEFLSAVSELQASLTENAKLCGEISREQSRMCEMYSDGSLGNTMQGLAEQIGRLAARLDGSAATPAESSKATPTPGQPPPRSPQTTTEAVEAIQLPSQPPENTAETLDVIEPAREADDLPPERSGLFGRIWRKRE